MKLKALQRAWNDLDEKGSLWTLLIHDDTNGEAGTRGVLSSRRQRGQAYFVPEWNVHFQLLGRDAEKTHLDGSISKKIAQDCLPGWRRDIAVSMRHGIEEKIAMHGRIPGASIGQFPNGYGCRILDVHPDCPADEE